MQKEIRVRKANKILRVSENEVAKYIADGYDVIDNMGSVVQKSVPHDPNVLRAEFINNQATIKALKEEIEALKNEIQKLKTTPTKTVVEPETAPIQTTKKRSKRSE